MIKKSNVSAITPNGSWEGKYGLMYKFEIEMENGDIGEYSSKSKEQTKFIVGQETEYEYIDGAYPKIKPVNTFNAKPNYSSNKDTVQEYIIKQSSLKVAVDLCIAQGIYNQEDIINRANAFTDWVLDRNLSSLPFAEPKVNF